MEMQDFRTKWVLCIFGCGCATALFYMFATSRIDLSMVYQVNNDRITTVNFKHTRPVCKICNLSNGQDISVSFNQSDSDKRLRQYPAFSGIYRVPSKAVHVTSSGDFLYRISKYNEALDDVRQSILQSNNAASLSKPNIDSVCTVVAGVYEDYLEKLSTLPGVTGIFLDWQDDLIQSGSGGVTSGLWSSLLDKSNLLIQHYYPWVGSKKMCGYMKNEFTWQRFDTIYNKKCTTNTSHSLAPQSMELFFLNAVQVNKNYYMPFGGNKLAPNFYTDVPQYVMYIHLIQDGVVTQLGEVFTGSHKIVPYNCHPVLEKTAKYTTKTGIVYDEVFSISQYWGKAFFHKTIEEFPKLAPYVSFLQRHRNIKIHVAESGSYTSLFLSKLGIEHSRLVSGQIQAHVIYLPRGTSCGFTHIQEAQLLSLAFRNQIKLTKPEKYLILIRRIGHRYFTERSKIAEKVGALAKQFDLKFYVFRDDPVPPLDVTMKMFAQAVMVVAPHGAGLSNILYSPPGTYIIEGVCNFPASNLCYTRLSHLLGHHYHALISDKGCERVVNIQASEIEQTVKGYLELLKETGRI